MSSQLPRIEGLFSSIYVRRKGGEGENREAGFGYSLELSGLAEDG